MDWTIDNFGNVYLVGSDYDPHPFVLLKINSLGELEWQHRINTPYNYASGRPFIAADQDGSIIVAAVYYRIVPDPGNEPPWVFTNSSLTVNKFDAEGNSLWGGPIIHEQTLTCGTAIHDMVIDDAGFIYISINRDSLYCSRIYYISPTGTLNSTVMPNTEFGSLLAMEGSALITNIEITTFYCMNPEYPEDDWYNVEKKTSILELETGSATTWLSPFGLHSCTIGECGDYLDGPSWCTTIPGTFVRDYSSGSVAVIIGVHNYCPSQGYWNVDARYINVYDPVGSLINSIENDYKILLFDNQGNLLVNYGNHTRNISPTGEVIWESEVWTGNPLKCVVDSDNYAYIMSGTTLNCLNPDDGGTEWACQVYPYDVNGSPNLRVDNDNRFYVVMPHGESTYVASYQNHKKLVLLDGSQDNNPIANTEFWLIRMHNDIPVLTEDTLGKFTSDENGEFELNIIDCGEFEFVHDLYNGSTSDILSVGDTLKIAKYVASRDAVKHADLLATMFNIHLDNAIFKIGGEMIFDTLDNMAEQEIILDHSEFRYNLVVSVEWDASVSYLTILEENMKYMSNFLYDITDGQVRLDTIRIFDDMEHWDVADVRIKADNMVWPHCRNDVAGINYPSAGGSGREIIMPRKWFGNQDESRNNTEVTNLFYSLVNQDYRTKAHEFGHYVLGFYDEYMFWDDDQDKYRKGDDLRCPSMQGGNYGTMDHHYLSGEPFASEISSRYRYIDPECRNTEQYRRHDKSCWDHFETWVEAFSWGPDNIYVPLLKPDLDDEDERHDIGTDYLFIGPNNDPEDLDYDAGSKIIFTETPSAPNPDFGNIHIRVALFWGGDKADVFLTNSPFDPSEIRYINQGQTADNAQMLVLGAKTSGNDHLIQAFKSGTQGTVIPIPKALSVSASGSYACGLATAGKSGVSKVGNYYHSPSFDTDTLIIELRTIEGEFPAISDILLSGDQAEYRLQCPGLFPSEPSLDLITDYGHQNTYTLDLNGSAYVKLLTDSLGDEGYFMIWAEDDSAGAFFFINEYVLTCPDFDDPEVRISGAGGQSELLVDSINNSIEKIIIVSSSYPVPLDGFTEGEVVKAGKTHTVSCYPNVTLAGDNQIFIHYFDSDLQIDSNTTADELSLAIYKWNVNDAVWDYMGGSVDTSLNYVTEKITNAGVYAAFTTDIITGVEDDEDDGILPYRFELSQNYPNPFNPVTTIDYNLPRRSHVTIEVYNVLGQKVQTLVGREESAGSYTITWDGTTANGQPAATGVYLYRFQAGDHIETKKMILLK